MIEVEPSAHWVKAAGNPQPRGSRRKLAELDALSRPVILHGVGYPVGGATCDQAHHVPEFRRWAEALDAPWVSEHLSVFDVVQDGAARCLGFLMPPVQSEAGVRLAAANIVARRGRIGRPFAFETGVSYLPRQAWEMPDGDYFAGVAEAADCGVLLDLNNLWVNERNGRGKVADVLAALPLERVWELHLARADLVDGVWLDAHSGAIDPQLAALAADVVADLPNLGAIIFEVSADRLPGFGEADLLAQMETLHDLWSVAGSGRSAPLRRARSQCAKGKDAPSPQAWESGLARGLAAGDTSCEPAFALYSRLILAVRKGAVADLLANSISVLLRALGPEAFDSLFAAYALTSAPALFPNAEALAFASFLEDRAKDIPGLGDILAFEAALVTATSEGRAVRVELTCDIEALLAAVAAAAPLADVVPGPCALEITVTPRPSIRRLAAHAPRACSGQMEASDPSNRL